jgi:DNA primase
MGRKAYDYLRFRGLTHQEIERYALGYCATGVYAERVIIPIIDERGLQYFVARSFTTREPRYLNPHRDRSDILFWTEVKPQSRLVVVCEGVFDAMRVGRLLPACALLGHELTPDQLSRLEARADYAIILMDPDVFTASLKLWVMVKPHVQAVAIKLKRKDPADYMNADALVHEVVNYLVAQPGVSRTLCEEFRQQIMTHLAGRN